MNCASDDTAAQARLFFVLVFTVASLLGAATSSVDGPWPALRRRATAPSLRLAANGDSEEEEAPAPAFC